MHLWFLGGTLLTSIEVVLERIPSFQSAQTRPALFGHIQSGSMAIDASSGLVHAKLAAKKRIAGQAVAKARLNRPSLPKQLFSACLCKSPER